MSTTAVNATATTEVKITDYSLLPFHQQSKNAFEQTKHILETTYPAWEITCNTLEQFKSEVRAKGGDLQHQCHNAPEMKTLQDEKEKLLRQYWDFKGACDRIHLFAKNIQRTITFLTPTPRLYSEEQRLAQDNPEFLAQIKREDEICLDYVKTLGDLFTKVEKLRGRMDAVLAPRADLPWSMQRYCQIVDQGGVPLTAIQRSTNNLTTPVVPRHKNRPPESKTPDEPTNGSVIVKKSADFKVPVDEEREKGNSENTVASRELNIEVTFNPTIPTVAFDELSEEEDDKDKLSKAQIEPVSTISTSSSHVTDVSEMTMYPRTPITLPVPGQIAVEEELQSSGEENAETNVSAPPTEYLTEKPKRGASWLFTNLYQAIVQDIREYPNS